MWRSSLTLRQIIALPNRLSTVFGLFEFRLWKSSFCARNIATRTCSLLGTEQIEIPYCQNATKCQCCTTKEQLFAPIVIQLWAIIQVTNGFVSYNCVWDLTKPRYDKVWAVDLPRLRIMRVQWKLTCNTYKLQPYEMLQKVMMMRLLKFE